MIPEPERTEPILSTAGDLLVTNAVNVDDPVPQQPSIVTSLDPVEMIETEMTDVALVRLLRTSTDMSQAKKLAPLLRAA